MVYSIYYNMLKQMRRSVFKQTPVFWFYIMLKYLHSN